MISSRRSLFIPPKTSENQRFSDVFRGYKKSTSGTNGIASLYMNLSGRVRAVLQSYLTTLRNKTDTEYFSYKNVINAEVAVLNK